MKKNFCKVFAGPNEGFIDMLEKKALKKEANSLKN